MAERDAERLASEAREARARSEARADAAKETVDYAAERIQEAQETTPEDLLKQLAVNPEDMPASEAIENDVNRLKWQRCVSVYHLVTACHPCWIGHKISKMPLIVNTICYMAASYMTVGHWLI